MLRKNMQTVKCTVIGALVVLNLMMALYTIPLLLGVDDLDSGGVAMEPPGYETKSLGTMQLNRMRRYEAQDQVPLNADFPGLAGQAHARQSGDVAGQSPVNLDETFDDYSHNYLYIQQASHPCEKDPFLLIVVCSAVQNVDLREAIRNTWGAVGKKRRLATKVVFMLGAPTAEYTSLQSQLEKEGHKYGDIIQENVIDSYKNLTLKTIGALKWAQKFCSGTKFFMKTDDDVFINVPNLIQMLMDFAQDSQSRLVLGHVIEGAKPIADRNSKWYTPTSLFKSNTYPRYVSGSAYVFSGNIVEDIYYSAVTRKPFWLEDIFITGMLAGQVGAALINSDKFTISKSRLTHACFYRVIITAHELTPSDLHKIWKDLHQNDLECSLYVSHFTKSGGG